MGGPLIVAVRDPHAYDPTTATETKKPTEILGGLLLRGDSGRCPSRPFGRSG